MDAAGTTEGRRERVGFFFFFFLTVMQ
jgi:hypothetical protein